jgi:peptide/nickel transport system permease protein
MITIEKAASSTSVVVHPRSRPTRPPSRAALRGRLLAVAAVVLALVGLSIQQRRLGIESDTDLLRRLLAPSRRNLLGTDQFGRDVLALTIAGLTSSLGLAFATLGLSAAIGVLVAMIGTAHRYVHAVLATLSDTLLGLPSLVVAIVLGAALGSGTTSLLIALSALGWTPFFRVMSAQIHSAQSSLWVEAANASGATPTRIVTRHVLPNVTAPLLALATSRFGHAIVSVSSLSFLGVGPQPPSAEWGATIAAAQPLAERAPWVVAAPTTAIFVATAAAFAIGRRVTHRLQH